MSGLVLTSEEDREAIRQYARAAERGRLREKVEALREALPFCSCGLPATCYGAYEGQEPEFMCDVCCGHGCEDGWCISVWKHLANEVLALLAEPGEERA